MSDGRTAGAISRAAIKQDLQPMLRLAWPVILAELGWISMGIVDTVMVRELGPAAIGAVGTGSTIFMTLVVLGMGTLLALDTFVSQSFGANRLDECHRWLFTGMHLAALLSIVVLVLAAALVVILPQFGLHPDVLALLQPYLARLLWSAPPLLAYTVFRRYLQSMNLVRPVMIALLSANLINAAANWVLVYGRLGLPALGVSGSAYATDIARVYLALFLFGVIVRRERTRPTGLHDVPFGPDWARVWQLFRLGFPAAMQVTMEVGVFAAASALAAKISPMSVAANQIVLNVASFIFMVPFGLASAAAVRVGQAVGRRDAPGVRHAGWVALGLALTFEILISAWFVLQPRFFLGIFTGDEALLKVGAAGLLITAINQPFDGVQTVATGALRGVGDTRTPMLMNLAGHWAIGLPVAYWLCFVRGWGIEGLWTGLALGLILIGAALVGVWWKLASAFGRS